MRASVPAHGHRFGALIERLSVDSVARESRLAVGKPMLRLRRFAFDYELLRTVEDLAIGDARALVLAQVLEPRFVHEAFEEPRKIGRVVDELPEIRAVAQPHFAKI